MTYNLESGKGGREVTIGVPYAHARALWVGGAGDVIIRFPDGSSATYHDVSGLLPVESVEVLAGSTATNITTIL